MERIAVRKRGVTWAICAAALTLQQCEVYAFAFGAAVWKGGAVTAHSSTSASSSARWSVGSGPNEYECDTCSLRFAKLKQMNEHLKGKRHAANVRLAETIGHEFDAAPWPDDAEGTAVAARAARSAFSFDKFFERLPRRTRSSVGRGALGEHRSGVGGAAAGAGSGVGGMLDPGILVKHLTPEQRGQLWRYLREVLPPHEPEKAAMLPRIFVALEGAGYGQYLRVKEILESIETYLLAESWVLARRRQGRNITAIHDLACGHGLVGLLLALRFDLDVASYDLIRRPAYDAFVGAFRDVCGGLFDDDRLYFSEGDFNLDPNLNRLSATPPATATSTRVLALDSESLVLCIHGCNEANRDAVEIAQAAGAAWFVMPCCIKQDLILTQAAHRIRIPDDDLRAAFLVGAMAAVMPAEEVYTVDRRITGRSIVLAGGPPPAQRRRAVSARRMPA